MANCGQMCVSVERVYVESAVYDAFVSHVAAKAAALRSGVDIGTFTSPAQAAVVQRHLDDALTRGRRPWSGVTAVTHRRSSSIPTTPCCA